MRSRASNRTAFSSLISLASALALLAPSSSLRAQQEWTLEGDALVVTNLVGEVEVRGHDASEIVVRARPGGRDADRIRFELGRGDRAEFHTVFPLDETRQFVYPRMRSGRTTFSIESWRRESSILERLLSGLYGRDRIEVRGSGGGLEAWVDLEILVPNDVATRVHVGVGELTATDVEAPLDLDSNSGIVRARNVRGELRIDTGSGSVQAEQIRGDMNIDTGSGSVVVKDVQGDDVRIDTGSGRVEATSIVARRLLIDTGSGAVRTADADLDESTIDTGSGSVTLSLVRLDSGSHVIDTGSGRVTIEIPADAAARISAETGSGTIRLDVPSARMHRMSRDEVEVEVGDGRARLRIETGSGGVTIRSR